MNLVKRAATFGAGMSLADLDRTLDAMYGGTPSYTGKFVSQTTALAVSTVWACCLITSGDFATLPFLTYHRTGESSRIKATDHYLWDLLQHEANAEMSADRFKRLMQVWVMLWGNAYAEIEISGRGQVTGLWPWRPDRVRITRDSVNGPLQYTYTMADNRTKVTLPAHRILHIRGMSLDGVTGLSPIEYHKQTIGLSMAITEHGSRYFSNGARPLGILTHPSSLSDKAMDRLKKSWAEQHQGLDNSHRVAILEEGMTWNEAGANMVDAQYIEAQGMTAQDICRIYNVPQHRVGLLDRATNNNVAQLSLEYVTSNMLPLCANWKSECQFSLLSRRELKDISLGFVFINILRGDWEMMGKFISVVRQWGIYTANEVREMLDMDPLPGGQGDEIWRPVNMADSSGQVAQPTQPQAPAMDVVKPKTKPNGKPNGQADSDHHHCIAALVDSRAK